MAPAPKSRVPKGEVVDSSGKTTLGGGGDINSTDDGDDKRTQHEIGTIVEDISKENKQERDKSPRIAPNLRRISSSIAGSDRERLLKRTNTAEMREHLKHLGPSNLASRPRQTRYNTVKIKPGSDAASGDRSKNQDALPKSASKSTSNTLLSPTAAQDDGIHDGLISAGAKEAQDGALAVLQGYGTITPTPTNPGKPPRSSPGDERPSSKASNGSGKESPSQRASVKRNTSHSTQGSQNNGSTSRPDTPKIKKSLTISVARSGCITKNIVEAGGTQKMVLEQSSSSEEQSEQPGRSSDNNTGESDEKAPEDGTIPGGENSTGNRKKRRRRKRKGGPQSKIPEEGGEGGEGEEEEPFLQGGNKG